MIGLPYFIIKLFTFRQAIYTCIRYHCNFTFVCRAEKFCRGFCLAGRSMSSIGGRDAQPGRGWLT